MQGRITFDRSSGVRRVNRLVVLNHQPCHQESGKVLSGSLDFERDE